ncbi:hypothetical protein BDL97_06G073800 [Sphagnum fallax]|jgi:thiol-disulfide isomerase/thioredoxin|nr:hypothetical protein BDL97_06G073800 [Sphagnum fallax]
MTQLLQLCVPAARWTDPKWGGGATAAASCRGIRIVTIVACNNNIQWKRREEKCSRRRRGGGLKCWRIHHAATRRDVVLLPSIRAQLEKPLSMELTPITLEAQFDQILETGSPVVIDWMAKWCRKCIYLKPKLERLAAEYHPHIKFYSVDVNDVPAILLKRAEVSKMPTIQLWRNKEKEGEVIGGDTAGHVMDQVRAMLHQT